MQKLLSKSHIFLRINKKLASSKVNLLNDIVAMERYAGVWQRVVRTPVHYLKGFVDQISWGK